MANDFLTWWGQQLISLLPKRFTEFGPGAADSILIFLDIDGAAQQGVRLFTRKSGQLAELGQFPLDRAGLARLVERLGTAGRTSRLAIQLAPGEALEKRLSLPLAAERELDRVLRYEMDSETPFSADEVYWDWEVEKRDRAKGKLSLMLSLIPRARLAPVLAAFEAAGIIPRWIEVPLAGGRVVSLPLAHEDKLSAGLGRRRLQFAWAGCAALAMLAVALPFVRQHWALSSVEARIAAAKPLAEQAQSLRAQIDGLAGGGDVVQAERARRSDPLKVLAALTGALPDDSFLTDLLLKDRKLTITGQSATATRLIGAIAGNSMFGDPAFAAPVTRLGGDAGKLDVFAITTDVRGEP